MFPFFLTASFSYLLGSIPFGYILLRIFRGQDVRQTGSGNIGATNVARSSPMLGILTLLLDALKGAAAVAVTRALFPDQMMLAAIAALFAILSSLADNKQAIGRRYAYWCNGAPALEAAVAAAAITVEPESGSAAPTSPVLFVGKLATELR